MSGKTHLFSFVCWFALAGACGPVLLYGLWWSINSASSHNLAFEIVMEKITLFLWPSSIVLLATENMKWPKLLEILVMSVATNVVLYSVLGALVWLGYRAFRNSRGCNT